MKILLSILALVITLNSFGQLPEYSSNVSDLDISQSLLYEKFGSDYQFILGYRQMSVWFKREEYSILTFNGCSWKLIEWSHEIRKNGRPKKVKSTSINLDAKKVYDFLNFVDSRGFFSFNQDSLNWNKRKHGEGTVLVQVIMDGTTEEFEIISASGHRIYWVHEAEQRQIFIHREQRKLFIECRNKFLELTDQKSP